MPLQSFVRRRPRGFTLIELLVVVAVLGIVAAIAIPNMKNAVRKARQNAAYKNVKVLESGVQTYMLDNDQPPLSLNMTTLEPLVSGKYIAAKQKTAILSSFEGNALIWYYGWAGGGWWDYDYGMCFRPKKDASNVYCYLWPEGIWRWEGASWTQVM